jgi:hypothetical protein
MDRSPTHLAFTDESCHNTGRFRGVGLVTIAERDCESLRSEVTAVLRSSEVQEFSWKDLRSARYRFAAMKLLSLVTDNAHPSPLRIDVLTWDTHDRRHAVRYRDDRANLERMHYHLFNVVLAKRWPDNAVWRLHPDEHEGMRWAELKDILRAVGSRPPRRAQLALTGPSRFAMDREFAVSEVTPVSSDAEPLVQVADLFVGLSTYSRMRYSQYEQWRLTRQPLLVPREEGLRPLSGADHERCQVLDEFAALCRRRRLPISFETTRGFRTHDPRSRVNFWWWEPQHQRDRAPVKQPATS